MPIKEKNEYASRLLEVLEMQCMDDGELYAQQLNDLLRSVEEISSGHMQPVLEKAIEMVLLFIQSGEFS
jgi:AP-4 complex subunit epsilon-1